MMGEERGYDMQQSSPARIKPGHCGYGTCAVTIWLPGSSYSVIFICVVYVRIENLINIIVYIVSKEN